MSRPRLPRFSRAAWLLLLTSAGGAIGVGVFGVVFNLYITRMGLSSTTLGWILGAGTGGAAVGVLPAGLLADSWGRKRTLILGGLLGGPATALQCLTGSTALLVGTAVVAGLGTAAIAVVGLPMLLEAAESGQQPALLATGGALAVLCSAAGSALGGWLPAAIAGPFGVLPNGTAAYRATLLLAIASSGVTALPLLVLYRDPHHRLPWRRTAHSLADPAWRSLAWRVCAIVGAVGLGAGFTIPYLNLYFTEVIGITPAAFGVISAASQLLLGAATLLSGPLADRFGIVRLVAATQLLSVAFLLALAVGRAPAVAAGAFVLRQSLMDMTPPVAQGWLLGLAPPAKRATTSSLLTIAQQLPWAVSSVAGGSLQATVGFLPGFLLTATLYTISSALWLLLFRGYSAANRESAPNWVK